jgi:DNA end-binding protein Ku
MAARAVSSGTISFGLVSIPIKLYAATQSKDVRFHMLDPRDKSRVKQQYLNAATGEPVERASLVKGYEYARDQYVLFTDAELKDLERKTDRSIEIEEFVPVETVDPLYFDSSSLLGPDKGGAKAYRLLTDAMKRMGRVAIGRFATRGREQLVLIRPLDGGLVLHGLHYADEVRGFEELEIPTDVKLKSGELELAQQLIEQLSSDAFKPEKYEDEYRQALLAAVDRKVAGEEVVAAPREAPREQIIDLVAALKRSLAEKQAAPAAAGGRERKPAKVKGKAKPAAARRRSASG